MSVGFCHSTGQTNRVFWRFRDVPGGPTSPRYPNRRQIVVRFSFPRCDSLHLLVIRTENCKWNDLGLRDEPIRVRLLLYTTVSATIIWS